MSDFFAQFFCDQNKAYSVVIEDDGKVAYAYLMFDDRIIGDLWLYNNAIAPESINWEQQDSPFLNPNYFLKTDINMVPIVNRRELLCQWTMDSDCKELLKVDIIIKKVLIGRLNPGDMPGYSTLVKIDGPLAKVLTGESN